MAPTTEFEDTGGTDWTSPSNEQTFLETIASETSATLSQAGTSVDGLPMWRMDLGDPSGGTYMVVAAQHGSERASREAALQYIRDLAYSVDVGVTDYLASHRVVMLPTANPDGVLAGQRNNSNGEDLNRQYYVLSEPEARAIAEVRTDAQPVVLIDCHEGSSFAEDVTYRTTALEVIYGVLDTQGDNALTAIGAALDTEGGITHAEFTTGSSARTNLRESSGLAHAVSLTLETNVGNAATDRVAHALIALDAVRDWHDTNDTTIADTSDDSRTYQSTTTDQYILQTGTGQPPWPTTPLPEDLVGYRMQGSLPSRLIDAYGIVVTTLNQVPLSQEARGVIPILLDEESDDVLVTSIRLTTLAPDVVIPTVQELAPIVSGSHRMLVEAYVLDTFQVGFEPVGELIDVIAGDVTYDATAEVFATLEMETSGIDERRRSRFPRIASDLLAPYGHEVFIRRGIDAGDTIFWSPLGYFRLDDDEQAPASDGPVRLSGQDRMSGIIDGRLVIPRQYRRTRTFGEVVTDLVTDIYPAAVIVFDDDSHLGQIGRTMLVEEDRHAALLDLAESLGKVIYFDGEGVLRIEDAPDPDNLVWDIKAGHNGVLVDVQRRVSREGMANAIVARGEGGDTQEPVQAIVVDDGPTSPTRWFPPDDPSELWFGQVPHFYSSPLVTTESQAVSAATSLLRRRIGMPYSADFGSVVLPALRPRQAVRVTQKDGTRERHLVDTLTVPLVAQRHMTGTTREQTQIVISEVKPSTLRRV